MSTDVHPIDVPIERGDRACQTCGKAHNCYRSRDLNGITWADPVDGHPYRPEPWETLARRLMVEHEATAREALP